MNKEERETMRRSLRKPKMYRCFLYFPKSGMFGSATLEFQKNEAEREKRLKELKKKRGNKFAKGRIEAEDDGILFKCKKKAPPVFEKDLKKWARKVPELGEYRVIVGDEESKDVVRDEDDEGSAQEVVLDAANDDALREALQHKLRKKPRAFAKIEELLDRYQQLTLAAAAAEGDLGVTRASHKIARRKYKDGSATLGELIGGAKVEDDKVELKRLTDARARLDEDWGILTALGKAARVALDAVRVPESEVHELRATLDKKKIFAKAESLLDLMEAGLADFPGAHHSYGRSLQRFAVDLLNQLGDEYAVDVEVPDAPPVEPWDSPTVIDRLRAQLATLVDHPLREDLTARLPLVDLCLAAPVPGADAMLQQDLAMRMLLSKVAPAKIQGKLTACDVPEKTEALRKRLAKAGVNSSSDITHYLRACREICAELAAKYVLEGNGKVRPPAGEVFDIGPLAPFLSFPGHMVGGAFATVTEDDGTLALVKLPASSRVIVVGGGPIGLMCALEAASQGARVLLMEVRSNDYSRQNVLALEGNTVMRLKKYGFYDAYPHPDQSKVKVADLEDGLFELAGKRGIQLEKGRAVTDIQRADNGDMLVVAGNEERCRLVIVCAGPAVSFANKHANDVILAEKMGITFDAFELTDHVMSVNLDKSKPLDQERQRADERPLAMEGNWDVVLGHETDGYALLEITEEEYERAKDSADLMMELAIERLGHVRVQRHELDFEIRPRVGRFEVKIQRAAQFRGEGQASILVGDSAGTPHPEQGSGTNTGAKEVDAVKDLVRNLQRGEERGTGDESLEEGLEDYNDRLEDIVGSSSSKGVRNQLYVRVRHLWGAVKRVKAKAKTLGVTEPGALGFFDGIMIGNKFSPELAYLFPAIDDPIYEQDNWDEAARRGKLMETFETTMTDLHAAMDGEPADELLVYLTQQVDDLVQTYGQ